MLPGEGPNPSNTPVSAPTPMPAPAPVRAIVSMPPPAALPAPIPAPPAMPGSVAVVSASVPMHPPAPVPVPVPAKEQSVATSSNVSNKTTPAQAPKPPKVKRVKAVRIKPKRSRYRRKYTLLKNHIKDLVLMNVAYCDQIAETQEKILVAMGKRRYLAKKLLHHQTASESENQLQVSDFNAGDHVVSSAVNTPAKKVALKKRPAVMPDKPLGAIKLHKEVPKANVMKIHRDFGAKVKTLKDNTKVIKEGVRIILKPKKARMMKPKPLFQGIAVTLTKKLVQAVPLDGFGRPVIPIVLGDLIIDSLGDIVHDRPAYHTNDTIYPVGFCSTRVYGSTKFPGTRCIYSCKILDGGAYPKFEIHVDGEANNPVVGDSPDSCHLILIQQIKQHFNINLVKNVGRGAEFFGLKHPVVLNALQSLPGCKRCLKYRSSRFEVSAAAEEPSEENDPTLNYKALQKLIDKPLYRVGLKFEEEGY